MKENGKTIKIQMEKVRAKNIVRVSNWIFFGLKLLSFFFQEFTLNVAQMKTGNKNILDLETQFTDIAIKVRIFN